MAVVVFDADVLIGFLGRADAHHAEAVEIMTTALGPETHRFVSAVNYSEVLIGPLRSRGGEGAQAVGEMFARLGIETVPADMELARQAAAVRVRTNLKLPDAYAVATAVRLAGDDPDVRVESFDEEVVKAHRRLLHG